MGAMMNENPNDEKAVKAECLMKTERACACFGFGSLGH